MACLIQFRIEGYRSPVCSREVSEQTINQHLDNACRDPEPIFTIKADGYGNAASSSSESRIRKQNSLAPIFSLSNPETLHPASVAIPAVSTLGPSTRKRKPEHLSGPTLDGSSKRGRAGPQNVQSAAPLAERLRPTSLDEFVGQSHLLGSGSVMRNMLDTGSIGSMIFWGPPGSVLQLKSYFCRLKYSFMTFMQVWKDDPSKTSGKADGCNIQGTQCYRCGYCRCSGSF